MNHTCITLYAAAAALCWLLTGVAAIMAVLSPRIRDTVTERIGLAWAGIGSFSAAYHIATAGVVSDLLLFVSLGFGFYVVAVLAKHWRECRSAVCHTRGKA